MTPRALIHGCRQRVPTSLDVQSKSATAVSCSLRSRGSGAGPSPAGSALCHSSCPCVPAGHHPSFFFCGYIYIYKGALVLWCFGNCRCGTAVAVCCEDAVTSPLPVVGGPGGSTPRLAPTGKCLLMDPPSAKDTELMRLTKPDMSSVRFLSLPRLSGKGSFALIWTFLLLCCRSLHPTLFGGLQKVPLKLTMVQFGLPQKQEVLHGHYFLIWWISRHCTEQSRARAKDASLPNECLCHEEVSPITTFLSHPWPPSSAPAGCWAGDGHRQRVVLATAQAARLPVYTQ